MTEPSSSALTGRKILITGGAGYIGCRAVSALLAQGAEVTVYDRFLYGGDPLLALIDQPGLRLCAGDVLDPAALEQAMAGQDAVIHLAGIVGEPAFQHFGDLSWTINHQGALATAEAARRMKVERFIMVSTCSNYGVSDPSALANEETDLNPLSGYARSKVQAERDILSLSGLTRTVLRLGTICGPSPRMRFDLLVNELARAAVLDRPIDIFAPAAWRPFLHVADAARAFAAVLSAPTASTDGRVFNVVGENHQKSGLVAMVRRHFPDADIRLTDKMPDLRDYRVSADRIAATLGFRPRHSVEDAFLAVAQSVRQGVFRDPWWPGHGAVPVALSQG